MTDQQDTTPSGRMAARPHEYVASQVGHGEAQCRWCYGTNRELAVIAPNHCSERAARDPTYTRRPPAPASDGRMAVCPEWRSKDEPAPGGTPVLAEHRAWDSPHGELMQHVVWWFDREWRPYPKTDGRAYVDRWRFMDEAIRQPPRPANTDALREALVAAYGFAKLFNRRTDRAWAAAEDLIQAALSTTPPEEC